jgi:hypothetical protein
MTSTVAVGAIPGVVDICGCGIAGMAVHSHSIAAFR